MKIGIDLGGSHIAIGVVDETGRIIEKIEKRLTSVEKKDIKKSIEETIIEHCQNYIAKYEIEKIGMAIPGWAENGVIMESGNIGIINYPIVEKLQEKIDKPITIRNDAKCAAIAEKNYGCLKGYNRSLFLTLGTGIGGAVFYEDRLLEAGKKPGFEIGHIVIQKDGIPCHCGRNGCFERYGSMKAFKNNLRSALGYDESMRGEQLLDMIRKNIPGNTNYEIIENVVSEYIENLVIGIENLINIFEPEIIGIGGSFVYFEDVLLPRLRCSINRKDIPIEVAVLGNDAGIIGAV